jgi:uncharacterized iron-regulated membrane protein
MEQDDLDDFDRDLEAEVAKVLDPGEERRRQVAVRDLHAPGGLSAGMRVVMVGAGITAALVAAACAVVMLL